MGKKILTVLLCIVLTGCMQSSQTMQERLDEEIAAVSAFPIPSASHRKPFYTYYTEPSIGHYHSTETSNEFSYQSTKFVMNLNVQAIMDSSTDIAQSIYTPATIALIGTPAAINDIVPAQILACEEEPFDSNTSAQVRIAYGNSSAVGNTCKRALSPKAP